MNYIKGFETAEATFPCIEGIKKGATVTFDNSGTIVLANSNDYFCGVVTDVRNNYCSVALKGQVNVPYAGITPSMGFNKLVASGNGEAMISDSGRHILVVSVNEINETIDIIL